MTFQNGSWKFQNVKDLMLNIRNILEDSYLTLKAPNKNCSRRYFKFLLLSFEENKA